MEEVEGDEEEYGFSRNYFLAKELVGSGKKSSRKLVDINAVDEQELRDAASSIVPKHEKEVEFLQKSYQKLYKEWVFVLRAGFGILMYGFGSKKALLEEFASVALTDFSVIVINGYLQSTNLHQVLVTMAEVLWGDMKARRRILTKPKMSFASQSRDDLLDFLNGSHTKENDCLICLLIHNIDGPGLRDAESQRFLAKMASCSLVRVIASIDHVNAPLLWDKKMAHAQFNWCWYHVPTFAPYKVEGVFFPLILANTGGSQSAKTASIVLQSLTPNAQSVFRILAEYQLAHLDEEGLPFNNLYKMCRERFLVSSQVTLNLHLTEFKDHELVKTRRNEDGQDCLYIPLASDGLEKLLQEIG